MPFHRFVSLLCAVLAIVSGSANAKAPTRPTKSATEPSYASPGEAKLRAGLLERLRPLMKFKLDDDQLQATKAALKLVGAGKFDQLSDELAKIKEPAARKLIEWTRLLRDTSAPAAHYAAFLKANPNWPRRKRLQRLFESAVLRDGGSAKAIKSHFAAAEPQTGAGLAALASAELALGNEAAARKLAARAWCFKRLSSTIEANFLARFDRLLSEKDHKCRLDRLLISNPRGRSIRRSRVNAARRLLTKLPAAEQQKARARINVFLGRRKGRREIVAVVKTPELVKGDWGLAFQRVSLARKTKQYTLAHRLLKTVPGSHKNLINPDEWWQERERHARYWLERGSTTRAYEIAAKMRPESANPAKEQAFFAGWLALMRLGKPKAARDHFKRMVAHADGPLSKSMSEYWLARAYQKLGKNELAKAHYRKSASIRDTFHGLMSARAANPNSRTIELPPARLPTPAEAKRFLDEDAVKGLLVAYAADLSRRNILAFYRTLGTNLESAGELALLAQLASAKGDGQGEVRTGKTGIARGFDMYEFAYPVHWLPSYEPLRKPVEQALLLAIGRQESEFNTQIVSRAGARGVLQVMPITARHICRQYRIKCRLKDLLAVPSYNAKIASAYIADRRDEFGGSYILTLTGFNAGPGRTRQWLRKMGDPRKRSQDPLYWIYRIPFLETRLYVRKVLSNVQIYRARLGEKEPLRLDKDLIRGRS